MSNSEPQSKKLSIEPLNRTASQTLHSQLALQLRAQIKGGHWTEGAKLPPERALCAAYEVSRITVRHAISQLEKEGLVSRLQGLGTYVSATKYEQPLTEIHSFEHAMSKFGYEASTRIHRIDTLAGDLLLSNVLQQEPTSSISQLQLIGLGNNTPIVFYDSYFSPRIGAKIIAAAQQRAIAKRSFSTLDLYRDSATPRPTSAEQTFESTISDSELSGLLEVPLGSPILQVTSVLSNQHGPLEYRKASYRGDKYKFVIKRDLLSERLS